jgi:hypothetical protein
MPLQLSFPPAPAAAPLFACGLVSVSAFNSPDPALVSAFNPDPALVSAFVRLPATAWLDG